MQEVLDSYKGTERGRKKNRQAETDRDCGRYRKRPKEKTKEV